MNMTVARCKMSLNCLQPTAGQAELKTVILALRKKHWNGGQMSLISQTLLVPHILLVPSENRRVKMIIIYIHPDNG